MEDMPVAVAIIVAVLAFIGRDVIPALRGKGDSDNGFTKDDHERLAQLHEWHDKDRPDGGKVWWVAPGIEEGIKKLGEKLDKLLAKLDKEE